MGLEKNYCVGNNIEIFQNEIVYKILMKIAVFQGKNRLISCILFNQSFLKNFYIIAHTVDAELDNVSTSLEELRAVEVDGEAS